MDGKHKHIFILIALLFLGYVSYKGFSIPIDAVTFTPDSMYRGTSDGSIIDPKDYYYKLHGLTMSDLDDDSCITSVSSFPNSISMGNVGNYLPTGYSNLEETEVNYKEVIGTQGDTLFSDKQEIVMPVGSGVFKNSNMLDSSLEESTGGRHDIEIIASNRVIIVFEDVMTWWCHSHNLSQEVQHDKAVGSYSQSEVKEVRGGFIIGVSKESTRIKVYQIKDSLYNTGIISRDIKDLSSLEQIDAGAYLFDGEVKLVQ